MLQKNDTTLPYHAFGMEMPGRKWTASNYRFGYNSGSEVDQEIALGVSSTHLRFLDTRICRWWSVDFVSFPNESPYVSMANNPVYFNDPLGDRVKFAKARDFIAVAKMWLTSSSFRKDWKKNVSDKYGIGGKDKSDVKISRDANTNSTLSEAVHNNEIGSGASKKGDDHLKYNGNLEAADFEIGEQVEAEIKTTSGGSGRTSEEKYKINYYGNRADKVWTMQGKPNQDVAAMGLTIHDASLDVNKLETYFKISQRNSTQIMGNEQKDRFGNVIIPATYPQDGDDPLAWDTHTVKYSILGMGVRRVYRVEKRLIGSWDFTNKTLTNTSSFKYSRIKIIKAKTNLIIRDVYNTNKRSNGLQN